jgi:uncharacterized RDD family membrane protein YckC
MSHFPADPYPRASYGPPGGPPGPPPGPPPAGGPPHGPYGPYYGHRPPQDAYGPYLREGAEEYPPAAGLPLAPVLRRTWARLIDFALVAVFGFALIFPLMVAAFGLDTSGTKAGEQGGGWSSGTIFALFFVGAVLPFLYEAVQLAISGQTIGKRVLALRVVRADAAGDPPDIAQGVWRALINNIGYQIPIFLLLLLAVKVFEPALLLVFGAVAALVIAYLRAAWDRPLHQAVHDRYAGTVVVDERAGWEEE